MPALHFSVDRKHFENGAFENYDIINVISFLARVSLEL